MKSIIDNSNLSNFILNPEGKVVFVNDYACQVLGYTRDELTQMHPWDFDPDFNVEAWPGVWSQLKENKTVNIETRHRRKDGTVLDVEVRGHYIAHKAHEYSFTFVQDITERKLIDSELRIAATAFESQEGMIITDANSNILKINHSFTRITGYTSEESLGRKMTLLKSGIHDAEFYRGMWDSIQSTGSWQGEIWNRRKNGDIYPEWLTITAVKDAGGVITHYVGTMIDITARKAIEDRVHHLAHYDVLTDLPNRALLSDRLHQTLAQAKRDKSKLALIFLDLDYFKPVNDELGHEIGDLLLKQVALRLQHCIKRETDTLSRVGGDEFVIILSHIESDQDAALMADKIILSLMRPFEIEENVINISCSVGIGVYPTHGKDATSLMRVADNAMYQAKRAGRGRFCFYNPDTVNEKLTTRS
jgi:diguanylate cyclase (GGDEF)-like protein/PAS domain S-box-containing protein